MNEAVLPLRNALNRPFWDGVEAGVLVLPRCPATDRAFWPPSPSSPFTGGAVEWAPCDPMGTVESIVVYRRAFQQAFAHLLPYGIALVALDAGPRLMAHVQGPDTPGAPVVGDRVSIGFDILLAGGVPLPTAHPIPA